MTKALSKVQKQISKKRGGKPTALHVNSRDAQRLRAAGAREDKLSKLMNAATRANQSYVDRVEWFRAAMEESTSLSDEELLGLAKRFVERDDDELVTMKAQRRPGRPPTSQEEQLRQKADAEKREFRSGVLATRFPK